jgi:hypothetical protein
VGKTVDFAKARARKKALAEQKAAAEKKALEDFQTALPIFGGYSGLARRLGSNLTTVHGWARRGKVPLWRGKEIAALLAKAAKPARGARRKKAA